MDVCPVKTGPAPSPQILYPENMESRIRKVLFVCSGNTCRSPMAAAWLNEFGGAAGYTAGSAGLFPVPGSPISYNAVAALKSAGIEPSPDNRYDLHTAVPVTEDMIKEADTVVGISRNHAMNLIYSFPAYAEKIVSMPRDIPDPFGGDETDYSVCLNAIASGIKELFNIEV